MTNKKELRTPLSVLEPGKNKGLAFLTSFFGPEQIHTVLQLLTDDPTSSAVSPDGFPNTVDELYVRQLQEYFPSLTTEILQSELVKREHLTQANITVTHLRRLAFPHAELQLDMLNPIYYTTSNTSKRMSRLLANGALSTRYKYELLRQEVLMLTSLAYAESKYNQRTVENLNDISDIFENELFAGRYGEGQSYTFYSVHDSQTNEVELVSDNFISIPEINSNTQHYKQHTQLVRQIEGIGPVLVRQREKSTASALIKAIYKGSQLNDAYIDISQITDPSGFMFVTKDTKNHELYTLITNLITAHYPTARIVEDHLVDDNRNQSSSVSYLRMQVYLNDRTRYPIEIIISTQKEYLNYIFHLGKHVEDSFSPYPNAAAHALYELRRSYYVADWLFPQEIYALNEEETWEVRRADQERRALALLEENRVPIPSLN